MKTNVRGELSTADFASSQGLAERFLLDRHEICPVFTMPEEGSDLG